MNSDEYVNLAARTDAPLTAELLHRLTKPQTVELLHAALGMVTEAAEMADMLKKHIFANKPLDLVNASEEIGDELWYAAKAIRAIQSNMKAVMTQNINKLQLRYSEKFCELKSADRDTQAERTLLEKPIALSGVIKDSSIKSNQVKNYKTAEEMAKAVTLSNENPLSKRGQDWRAFSDRVLQHIEGYTVPQYGDKGDDQASSWDIPQLIEQTKKYANRFGKNSRENQEVMDFMKGAHYLQMAATRFSGGGNATD